MAKLTVEDLIESKKVLEKDIGKLITTFQSTTKVNISSLIFSKASSMALAGSGKGEILVSPKIHCVIEI